MDEAKYKTYGLYRTTLAAPDLPYGGAVVLVAAADVLEAEEKALEILGYSMDLPEDAHVGTRVVEDEIYV